MQIPTYGCLLYLSENGCTFFLFYLPLIGMHWSNESPWYPLLQIH